MLFKETSRYPLINSKSDVFDELGSSCFILFLCFLDGFEEELDKAFQRVLIHVINDTKRNAQEI